MSAIRDNQDLRPSTSIFNLLKNDFWGTPIQKEQSHKSYRPLCVLTYRINYYFHKLQPYGYHLTNIVMHAIVSTLYMRQFCLQNLWHVCGIESDSVRSWSPFRNTPCPY
ncbi:protein O-mannosyl-transferase Tmtc3 [Trichonephila inaurata madagascariensis]|uniref:Protein O-mannosyl-transferase Tmtc3 n=1 Tax=Trichonephila inaurata madagascariensis TaxID=2747483 RepID=A0A8X6MHY1_9ARAC|nr:protein O-mannosyl-transferase Tmtc3 [Trichonephila inaurata madagascariensis]